MIIDVIIDIFPKKEVLNPETEAVKKTLSNLGYKNIDGLVLSKQIKLSFKNLNEKQMIKDGLSAPLHPGAIKYYKERGWM